MPPVKRHRPYCRKQGVASPGSRQRTRADEPAAPPRVVDDDRRAPRFVNFRLNGAG